MFIGVYSLLIYARGFLFAYLRLWVFSGPQNTDKQEQKSAFFVMSLAKNNNVI